MLEDEESQKEYKSILLLKALREYGYNKANKISQNELLLFLDLRSSNPKFDSYLSEKLLNTLNINERTQISIEYFISKFIEFDEEIRKDSKKIKSEYMTLKESYNYILQQCEKYKTEKLNEEGFSQEGKLTGEVIDINLKAKLEGIQEIILKIEYSGQEFTTNQNLSFFNINESNNINKSFEFKAHTKKDNLIFILQGKDESGMISDLFNKEYSLLGLSTQDEILLKVELNENGQSESIIAELNVKLAMHWSYFKYYDTKRKMEEPKLNQIKKDLKEARDYLRKIDKIYGHKFPDSEIYIEKKQINCKEVKLQQNNNKKTNIIINKDIKNNESYEFSVGRYIVEFNNIKIIDSSDKGNKKEFSKEYKVDFNNKIDFANDKSENSINNN